ncbi:hypothetical protein KJ644_01975 [Candidatus Dependentiae bacterium]|nr:hypothetical protein [Candidatus Dependentiae bacterium]MBU4387220.1 hypothetical protein [Candidatus Dependentiae bacterium]MCG2756009.1 hypothetical protein [Candidatus Dependentiae bacterium]
MHFLHFSRKKLALFLFFIFFATSFCLINAQNEYSDEIKNVESEIKGMSAFISAFQKNYNDLTKGIEEEYKSYKEDNSESIFSKLNNFRSKQLGEFSIYEFKIELHKIVDFLAELAGNTKEAKLTEREIEQVTFFRPLKIGLYGDDIIRLFFIIADIINDRLFFKEFNNIYADLEIKQIVENNDQICELIDETEIDDTKKLKKNLTQYFEKSKKIKLLTMLKQNPMAIVRYFSFAEAIRLIKDKIYHDRYVNYDDLLHPDFKNFNINLFRNPIIAFIFKEPIQVSSLVEFFINRPSFRNQGLLIEAKSMLNIVAFLYQITKPEKTTTPKAFDAISDVLGTYYFTFAKELFLFNSVIKNFDRFYTEKKVEYIGNNIYEFINLIGEYNKLSKLYPQKTKQNYQLFIDVENKIKSFFSNAHKISFYSWLKTKNSVYYAKDQQINFLIMLPAYILLIKNIYDTYKLYFGDNYAT